MTPVGEVVEPLSRFSDHRTYPAAVTAVERILSTQGKAAAELYVAELVELFEDLYLSRAVG